MATDIYKLVMKMEADNAKLTTKLEQSTRAIKKFHSDAKKSFTDFKNDVAKIFAAVGLGLGIRQIVSSVNELIDSTQQIGKIADSIGIGTEEWQRYSFAAERSNIETQQMAQALQHAVAYIGQARNGTGALATYLSRYDAELLKNIKTSKSSEEGLQLLFKALTDGTDTFDKAGLAGITFGLTVGPKMLVLLKDGIKGLDDLKASATGVISDKTIRSAEELSNRFTDLGRIVKAGLVNSISELIGPMEHIARAMEEASKKGDLLDITIAGLKETFKSFFGGSEEALRKFNTLIKPNIDYLKAYGIELDHVDPSKMEDVDRVLLAAKLHSIDLAKQAPLSLLLKQIEILNQRYDSLKKTRDQVFNQSHGTSPALKVLDAGIAALDKQVKEVVKDYEKLANPPKVKPQTPHLAIPAGPDALKFDLANRDLTKRTAAGRYNTYINDMQRNFLNQAQDTSTQWGDIWMSALDRFSSGVGDAVAKGIFEQQSLAASARAILLGVAEQVVSTLVEIGVKQAALWALHKTQLISDVTFAHLTGAELASAYATPAALASIATLGAADAAAAAGISSTVALTRGLALSGVGHSGIYDVPNEGTYLLKGNELVASPQDATQLRKMLSAVAKGGGRGVTFVYSPNVSSIDSRGVSQILQQHSKIIFSVVQKELANNYGSF